MPPKGSRPATAVALALLALSSTACNRAALRGLPPGKQCVIPTDCPAPDGDVACLENVECSAQGECVYHWVATGGACDDQNSCTTGTTCSEAHLCGDGDVPVGDVCQTGSGSGICITGASANEGVCSPNHCYIAAVVRERAERLGSNACASCAPGTNPFAWTFDTPGTLCNDDADAAMDGVCAQADTGTDIVCRHDRCFIGDVLYNAGALRPDAECELCDPTRGEDSLTHWYSTVGRVCPFGCSLTPAPHCVQPSNWGYWSGTTAHAEGLTLDWIEANSGGSQSLIVGSSTIVIDTQSAGAPIVTINGSPLTLAQGVDYKIIGQSAFHDGTTGKPLPPGVGAAQVPDLVAIKFRQIEVTGTATVSCIGPRPLALASAGNVTLGGLWDIRCGSATAGAAQNATAGSDQYAIRGGGGGGAGGRGGGSGPTGSRVEGGPDFGRDELQPLLGGGRGGSGASTKRLDKSGLGGNETTATCWGRSGACGGTAAWSTFAEWESDVWSGFSSPIAAGGGGGGALQVVSLSALTVSGQVRAWGKGGEGKDDCAVHTATFDGTLVGDFLAYPKKWNCGGCPDANYADRWWRSWLLQTGGGGGGGGALLFEAPQASVEASAKLNVEGGGGGAGCYTNSYDYYVCYATPSTETTYGRAPGSSYWTPMAGGEGGASTDGVSSPYAVLNPSNETCDAAGILPPEVTLPTDRSVAWGGAGGAAGRVRIHTPGGQVQCGAVGCTGASIPALDLGCSASGTTGVCAFPSDNVHYKN